MATATVRELMVRAHSESDHTDVTIAVCDGAEFPRTTFDYVIKEVKLRTRGHIEWRDRTKQVALIKLSPRRASAALRQVLRIVSSLLSKLEHKHFGHRPVGARRPIRAMPVQRTAPARA